MYWDILKICLLGSIQILLFWVVIYWILRLFKGTTIPIIIYCGIVVLGAAYFLSGLVGLGAIQWIFDHALRLLPLIVVVLYHDELRKVLGNVLGFVNKRLVPTRRAVQYEETAISTISADAVRMSLAHFGALIAIEQQMSLERFTHSGKILHSRILPGILEGIFLKGAPLHDGGVIIRRGVIEAVSCVFPLSSSHEIQSTYGMRHQAAFGISEVTDAVVIVVSEEDGSIMVIQSGEKTDIESQEHLQQHLKKLLLKESQEAQTLWHNLKFYEGKTKAIGKLVLRKAHKADQEEEGGNEH